MFQLWRARTCIERVSTPQVSTSKKRLGRHRAQTHDVETPKKTSLIRLARRGISDDDNRQSDTDIDIVLENHHVDEARRVDKEHIALLKLRGSLNNVPATFLIDSGASANFVDSTFVDQNGIKTIDGEARIISLADGSTHRSTKRLRDVDLVIGSHEETQTFTVLPLKGQSAILGMPWLSKSGANIDWRKRRILIKKNDKVHQLCMLGELQTTSATTRNETNDNHKTKESHDQKNDRPLQLTCSSASMLSIMPGTRNRNDTSNRSIHVVRQANNMNRTIATASEHSS